jgi:nitrate reductase delta subunit
MPPPRTSPRASREAPTRFLRWLAEMPPTEVAQHHVETFDLRRRCALHLTYYRYGDTRKSGMAMLTFKSAYRAAGLQPTEDELPDYLSMVLDFACLSPRGMSLLRAHRGDLELLHRALEQTGTLYADVVAAVCAHLPTLGPRELDLVRRAWEAGPPAEEVGREPFAPPEYLAGYPVTRGTAGYRAQDDLASSSAGSAGQEVQP